MESTAKRLIFYTKLTLVFVYLVIAAGAIVRATGSGMGCPDWPKCFGQWVPPTETSQLPDGYKEHYVEKRKQKNEKLAKIISIFGANETANKLKTDPAIYTELDFNAQKTWIEYMNRLCGVLLGVFMIIVVVLSSKLRKTDPKVWSWSVLALLLLLFEGWLGSVVVSTNLLPWTITVHMLLAFGILIYLTKIVVQLSPHNNSKGVVSKNLLLLMLVITITQVVIGTQVREQIDEIASRIDNRSEWINALDNSYLFHRIISILVFVITALVVFKISRSGATNQLKQQAYVLMSLVCVEVFVGFLFKHFDLPVFAQPLHLINASIIFGLQYLIYQKISIKETQTNK